MDSKKQVNSQETGDDIQRFPTLSGKKALIDDEDIDFNHLAEEHGFRHEDGRLVVDPEEAKLEYGEEVATRLKLSHDKKYILWPQPTRFPEDPQNWPEWRKSLQLFIVTAAAFVPDFNSSLGIAALFNIAAAFDTTVDHVNDLSSNWSIFQLGTTSIIVIMLVKKFGRLPVLFWSQLIGLAFTIGCTVAPNLKAYAACRILQASFQNAPQVTGLFTICDMYPFHLQARKINLWNLGFIISPFTGPALLGFMVGRTSWRWIYGVGCIYDGIVLITIAVLARETAFDRHLQEIPQRSSSGLLGRVEDLVGITGARMAKYRKSWPTLVWDVINVVWRPQALLPLIYVMVVFGFGIGINVTNVVFVFSPAPFGYGLTSDQLAGTYFAPIIGVFIGEVLGHYFNDWIAYFLIKRNKGVFEAEMRLWTWYIGLPLFVAGFVTIGQCFQYKLNVGGLEMGWIMAECGILMTTVTTYNYMNNCFPGYQGEVSALINLFRVLGGFSVPYFQTNWATSHGAGQTFGVEAGIVGALFLLITPFLQLKGAAIRQKFSINHDSATGKAVSKTTSTEPVSEEKRNESLDEKHTSDMEERREFGNSEQQELRDGRPETV